MGSIKRERRVLKLVHPGKHIEVHSKPLRAEEVMRKNPRHCITRPDVFKFPWIVVKPESVLLPGSVFLIVPNHTIYDLLKASSTTQSQVQTQNQTPTNHEHNQLKQHSHDDRAYDGMSSTPQMHNQTIKLLLPFLSPEPMSQAMNNVCTHGERSQNQSHVKILPNVASNEEKSQKKRMELMDVSGFEFRPYYKALEYYEKYYSLDMLDPNNGVNLGFVSSEEVTGLKSCIRRANSMRKKLKLKVSFNIEIKKQ
ncbi:hypothetical protein VNO80_07074 [Phaseolus coccineus]|uniref:Uncharacterized protein n=1 Tax=Phaseolus coccineus TaxID=3886 RepID=A0AAN9NNF8_PHACN